MTTDTVSNITQTALGEGLAINVLSNSGDVEAMKLTLNIAYSELNKTFCI